MIAADTSVLVDYLQGVKSAYTERMEHELMQSTVVIACVVMTELFSNPSQGDILEELLSGIHVLELKEGFWERAGRTRALIKAQKRKANIADALIAQSCIDHNVPLLTRDTDFQSYATFAGLKLVAANTKLH